MREREDELESVYSGDHGHPAVPMPGTFHKSRADPTCLKRQTSDVSFSNYYEKYYAQQDFDPP